ncbi:hypothetical protein [Aeromicrobium alkaliterrae]|uniref:DUF3267 domain-containing protein n=1 Tax=Aeromicrobium alkaliterrae TaxID=302168 RepID=A0ABP4W5X9_9ACTN
MQRRATVVGLAAATTAQVWPLLALLASFTAGGTWWWASSGDPALARIAGMLLLWGVAGLTASFVLHEAAHLLGLRRIPTVASVRLERTVWRLSLIPAGTLTSRQLVAVALAGPGSCVAVGLLLALAVPGLWLHPWYLAHAVFVLPCFGDGRAILRAATAGRSRHAP